MENREDLERALAQKKEKLDINLEYVRAKEKELESRLRELAEQQLNNERMRTEQDEHQRKLAELKEEILSKQKTCEALDEKLKKKQEQEKHLSEANSPALNSHKVQELTDACKEYGIQLSSLKSELDEEREKNKQLEKENDTLNQEAAASKNEVDSIKQNLEELRRNFAHQSATLAQSQQETAKFKKLYEELNSQHSMGSKKTEDVFITDIKEQIQRLEQELQQKQTEIENLRKNLEPDIELDFKVEVILENPTKEFDSSTKDALIASQLQCAALKKELDEASLLSTKLSRELALQHEQLLLSERETEEAGQQFQLLLSQKDTQLLETKKTLDQVESLSRDLEVKFARLETENKSLESKYKQLILINQLQQQILFVPY